MWNVILILLALFTNPSNPPTNDSLLRSMPPRPTGIPGVFEVRQESVIVVKNWLTVRFVTVPLYGGATVIVMKETWECVMYFDEVIDANLPLPIPVRFQMRPKPDVTAVYVDTVKSVN